MSWKYPRLYSCKISPSAVDGQVTGTKIFPGWIRLITSPHFNEGEPDVCDMPGDDLPWEADRVGINVMTKQGRQKEYL